MTFGKVKSPYVMVAALADNRFAPVRSEITIDIPAAMEQEIQNAREAVAKRPDELMPVLRLTGLLAASLHYSEALQVADDAVKR